MKSFKEINRKVHEVTGKFKQHCLTFVKIFASPTAAVTTRVTFLTPVLLQFTCFLTIISSEDQVSDLVCCCTLIRSAVEIYGFGVQYTLHELSVCISSNYSLGFLPY